MSPATVQFAQKAAIFDGSRILMVKKSSSDPLNPDRWELPGGRLNPGESVEQHLAREIKEEVGLDVEPGKLVHLWSWVIDGDEQTPVHVVAVVRLCTLASDVTAITCENQDATDHLSDAQWFEPDKLGHLTVIEDQREAIKLALDALNESSSST